MTAAPSVSVVVAFLDAGRFLEEAIESVIAQHFDDWELLLVDDGSTDAGSRIAQGYARRDPRVRYLEHPGHVNLGAGAARNRGIREARGEFVAFLDADDVWMPEKLAEQLDTMRANPRAAMIFGKTRYWFGWTGRSEDIARDHVRACAEREDVLVRPPHFLSMTMLGGRFPAPSMSSVLLRSSALRQVGGFDESIRTMGEDTAFLVKVFLRLPVYYTGKCWDWYRQHPESFSAVTTRQGMIPAVNLAFLQWTREYFAQAGVEDARLLSLVDEHIYVASHPLLARIRPNYVARKATSLGKAWLKARLEPQRRQQLRALARSARRPWLALVRLGRLRRLWRTTPIHPEFGCYYGTPVDRIYIERFLAENCRDIRGTVLEIGEDTYTRRHGSGVVSRSEVLHAIPGNPAATIVADLQDAPHIESERFDCIILTQTLQCIYDYRAALRTLHRILKPGGVLLATFPGVAHQISREERPYWGDYWRWTSLAAERMFGEFFPPANLRLRARGNVLIAVALLHGLVVEELRSADFEYDDPDYEVCIAVRALKP